MTKPRRSRDRAGFLVSRFRCPTASELFDRTMNQERAENFRSELVGASRASGQHELFYDDFRGALAYAVKWMGGCAAVGKSLWPALSAKQAESKLSDCLSVGRSKLDLEEVTKLLSLARERGISCAIDKLCEEAGYKRPEIAPIKTREQELADELQATAERARQIAEEIGALRARVVASK